MATVDYAFYETELGQYVFIRSWNGQAYKTGGLNFGVVSATNLVWDGVSITADALLLLAAGVELPGHDLELVGNVCGTQQFFNDLNGPVYALPVICLPADGAQRIRELPIAVKALGNE